MATSSQQAPACYRSHARDVFRRALTLTALSVALTIAAPASAKGDPSGEPQASNDPRGGLVWSESWNRVRLWQYFTTPALVGASAFVALGTDFPDDGSESGVLFDGPIRDALVAGDRSGRDAARTVGDIAFRGMLAYPYLVDNLAVTWIGHGSPDVAWQMFMINTQSFGLTALLSLTPEHLIGRGRPSNEPCRRDDEYERFCNGSDEFASFPSGHTSIAATGAGLVCAHHEHLPLYGGGLGDTLACAGGVLFAATAGIARLVNDRHWATDVITGWVIGAASGYVVPKTLHYGWGGGGATEENASTGSMTALVPYAVPSGAGAAWIGAF